MKLKEPEPEKHKTNNVEFFMKSTSELSSLLYFEKLVSVFLKFVMSALGRAVF